ncbi:hypothetical protein GCM10027418_20120 [Mariniluteicoccus endophyticus]
MRTHQTLRQRLHILRQRLHILRRRLHTLAGDPKDPTVGAVLIGLSLLFAGVLVLARFVSGSRACLGDRSCAQETMTMALILSVPMVLGGVALLAAGRSSEEVRKLLSREVLAPVVTFIALAGRVLPRLEEESRTLMAGPVLGLLIVVAWLGAIRSVLAGLSGPAWALFAWFSRPKGTQAPRSQRRDRVRRSRVRRGRARPDPRRVQRRRARATRRARTRPAPTA